MINRCYSLLMGICLLSCETSQPGNHFSNKVCATYYSSGELKEKGALINNSREGLWIFYDPKGSIVYEAVYNDNDFNGEYISYFENGDTLLIGKYVNGMQHGFWKQFQGKQSLAIEGNYENGKKVGEWKYYNESGNKIIRRLLYEDGKETILEDLELRLPK